MKILALWAIKIYQKTLSFDHGPMKHRYSNGFCRFQPTCSEYTYQSIERFGVARGSWQGFKRILRCNPWSEGGWDPVDEG